MVRTAITPAAYAAIAAKLALGTVAVEPERAADCSVHIWLDPSVVAKLKALRGSGELQRRQSANGEGRRRGGMIARPDGRHRVIGQHSRGVGAPTA